MFERFTRDARQAVTLAQEEARQLHHGYIGTEHLLLGLLAQQETSACQVLSHLGLPRERAVEAILEYVGTDDLDAEALETLGIDLDTVRERVEAGFGEGALDKPSPSSGAGKRTPRGHVLLGLLREGEGLAVQVIDDRGIDRDTVRRKIKVDL